MTADRGTSKGGIIERDETRSGRSALRQRRELIPGSLSLTSAASPPPQRPNLFFLCSSPKIRAWFYYRNGSERNPFIVLLL